jgi:hypothetical protein
VNKGGIACRRNTQFTKPPEFRFHAVLVMVPDRRAPSGQQGKLFTLGKGQASSKPTTLFHRTSYPQDRFEIAK